MATGILIYEPDGYILRMLTDRLRTLAPDFYIADGSDSNETGDVERFCDEYYIMYDNRSYGETFEGLPYAIPIYEDGKIDCGALIGRIRPGSGKADITPGEAGVTLLISFVYATERERFIASELSSITDKDQAVKIELVPRIKSLGKPSSSLMELLSRSGRRRFRPEQILDYCSLDDTGFFSPGPVTGGTDLNNFRPEVFSHLAAKLRSLAEDDTRSTGVLIVADSVKTEIMTAVAGHADRIILLIPDAGYQFQDGICELISAVSRAASGVDIEIRYLNPEHLVEGGSDYEDAV